MAQFESVISARDLRRLVARLAGTLGLQHLALAEDAVQTAALRAVEAWAAHGPPGNPAGWLYVVARRWAWDALRGSERWVPLDDGLDGGDAPRAVPASHPAMQVPAGEERFSSELNDDELALLFAACHPVLPQATQVALALRTLVGLPLAELAPALLCTETALAQRLARARSLLQGQDLSVPAGAALAPRLEAALTVLSLMFLAGQQVSQASLADQGGPEPTDSTERASTRVSTTAATGAPARQACWEAIRLARALAAHPHAAHADADALAAMLLLHGARLTGRWDAYGELVPLPGQGRDRWDAGMLRMGVAHLQAAQRGSRLSRWHVLAGLAAEHALAPSWEATDWAAIVHWYGLLLQLDDSAAPSLGHAVALIESGQPQAGLDRLDALERWLPHALRAHSLAARSQAALRLGDLPAARRWLQQAIDAAPRAADARLLQRRLQAMPCDAPLETPCTHKP